MTAAALYVDSRGPYPMLLGVEYCWDKARDARTYTGPWPVVAHPPCQSWIPFASLNYHRYGGEHNRPGNDGGCFEHALGCVRTYGGVLEHPAGSKAWEHFGLTKPPEWSWEQVSNIEWVCRVWQSAYGHKARKVTWLLYCGNRAPLEARWEHSKGTHQCGGFDVKKPVISRRDAILTPIPFAQYLISLAERAT